MPAQYNVMQSHALSQPSQDLRPCQGETLPLILHDLETLRSESFFWMSAANLPPGMEPFRPCPLPPWLVAVHVSGGGWEGAGLTNGGAEASLPCRQSSCTCDNVEDNSVPAWLE
jgi:hypothetical protein